MSRLARLLLLFLVTASLSAQMKISGNFSSLQYSEDTGDLLGYEVTVLPQHNQLVVFFQCAQGQDESPVRVVARQVKNNIYFRIEPTNSSCPGDYRLAYKTPDEVMLLTLGSNEKLSRHKPSPLQQEALDTEAFFRKYPSTPLYQGKLASPVLSDPGARNYRTRLTEGAKSGPNFAGHYTVVAWGCGTGCAVYAIIDCITGHVTFFPCTVSQTFEMGERFMAYSDSNVVHVIGALNEENSADRWYLWNGHAFKLLREKPSHDAQGNVLH